MRTTSSIPPLARELLACFLDHPESADDLEGIARFRLPKHVVERTVVQVEQALLWLVEHGYLVCETTLGTSPLYRLCDAKSLDAQALLETGVAREAARAPERWPLGSPAIVAAVRAFLDTTLRLHCVRDPQGQDDVPGFSRGRDWLERVLQLRADASEVLHEAAQAAADAGDALREALHAGDELDPLVRLQRALALSWTELQALLLCLAPELDGKYQTAYAVLNDDMSRRWATLGLVCTLLGDPLAVRTELARSAGLVRWRLLEGADRLPYGDEPLRVDGAVCGWLLGDEAALLHDARMTRWQAVPDAELPEFTESARSDQGVDREASWLLLEDDQLERACRWLAGQGRGELAVLALGELDHERGLRIARAARLAQVLPLLDLTGLELDEATLQRCEALLDGLHARGQTAALVARKAQALLRCVPQGCCRVLRSQRAELTVTASAYLECAAGSALPLTRQDAEWLAMTFPLPRGEIARAVAMSAASTRDLAALREACCRLTGRGEPRLARRIEPSFPLEDVVLPADRHAQLLEMVAHVRCAPQVLKRWGFEAQLPYGRGVAALFHGVSGTGKTMAAQAVAKALGTDLYVVDLSRVVSKYIGESEKNLDQVFSDAEHAAAVLLFDEADALFGKRSEIKDAHDRYANIEVAYLLQRIEAYAGLAILTTNFRQNLDQAFMRRLRFVVEFPKPDAASRELIWRKCLPASAPLAHDLNLKLLARRLELTGGSIRQITVRAAFAAAAEGAHAIRMEHLVKAGLSELRKLGMPSAERELSELMTKPEQPGLQAV